MNSKFLLLSAMALATSLVSTADNVVNFRINDGIANGNTKNQMERNVSALLSEMGSAQQDGRSLNYAKIGISEEAKQQIDMLWMNVRFMCDEPEIVERCLTTTNGFQVRNIPLVLKPMPGESVKEDYQEAVINFDKGGMIVSFFFTIGMNMYSKIMQNSNEVTDLRRRMAILDYVEHFRTAYNMKDMPFLQQIFSEDALIITGRVIKVQKSEVFPSGDRIVYKKQNKKQYLTNLGKAFASSKYIKVNFDDIKVVAHPTKDNIYGVTVHQEWNSNRYSDEGYVFMIWDFTNEDEPKIHVRTWQPDYTDSAKKKPINPNDVFSLSDFVL